MSEDRTVVDETPDLSHWDLQDDELDPAAPARACTCFFPSGGCRGGRDLISS
jgi:hypothetical protein